MGVAVLEMSNGSEYKKGSENLSLFESLSRFAPCEGIPKSVKVLLVESEIRTNLYLYNLESWALESGIQVQMTTNPESSTWKPESMA